MARTNSNNNNNKYTSINFNHILHKDHLPSSSPSSSSSTVGSYSAVARSHGRMLVLSRPSPKPLTTKPLTSPTSVAATPPISPAPSLTPKTPDQAPSDPDPNQISLRPLGRTGPGLAPAPAPAPLLSSPVPSPELGSPVQPVESPKPDKFVPPHLRPGFVRREAKPGPDALRVKDPGQRSPNQQPQHHYHHHQPQQQQLQQRQGYYGSPVRYGQNGRPKSGGYERIHMDPDHLGRPRSSGSHPGST